MLTKKWHKLSIKEEENNTLKEEENKNEKEKENKEIIIVYINDINSNKEIEEKEKELEEEKKEKKLKIKPKPILKVDLNSIKIIQYKIENKEIPNNKNKNNHNYDISKIMNRYNSKKNNYKNDDYKKDDKYKINKNKYQIYETSNINEIKNKYIINDKDSLPISKYIPGSYRNSFNYNLNNGNNTYNEKNKNENEDIRQNTYYNYGPIYNYERKKYKNENISDKNDKNEKDKKVSDILRYKISNPYNNKKTYYISPKNKFIIPDEILNDTNNTSDNNNTYKDSFISKKEEIKKNYPNLFFNKNDNNSLRNINNISENNNLKNDLNIKNIRKNFTVERQNRKRNYVQITRAIFSNERRIDNLDSFNDNLDNKNKYIKKNNSMALINNYYKNNDFNFNNNNYFNSLLIKNPNYDNNSQYSYIINDSDNIYQYYPSYNKSNGFSGNSTFSKLNFLYG